MSSTTPPLPQNFDRLKSLDMLRGFDIFCLVFLQPILFFVLNTANIEWLSPIKSQLEHAQWEGFTCWDLIMPLFMFMAGVAIPFSIQKYYGISAYWRILRRFVLLFLFGMIVQGRLLSLDPQKFSLFSNTLQAIAVGYAFTAIVFLNFKTSGRIIACVIAFFAYWIPMTFYGDFVEQGNLAEIIDKEVLGRWRDGVIWKNGVWSFSPNYNYTWILSSFNFCVTTMLGAFTGSILLKSKDKYKNLRTLIIFGILLLLSAYVVSWQMPIIKKIWSSSMTLLSGGYCVLLMALFYWLVDVKNGLKKLSWLDVYGKNCIVAYVLFMAVNFRCIGESLFYGLKPFGGNWYALFTISTQCIVVLLILITLNKLKIYLKI